MQHWVSVVSIMSVLLWKAWERLFNVDKKVSSWISHFDVRDVQWIQSNASSYHFLCQVLLNLFVPSILWALPLPLLGADFQTQKHDDAVHRVNMSSVPKKDAEVVLTHPDGSEIPPRKVQIMWMVLLVNKKHYNIKLFYLCLVWCFLLTAVSLFISCFFVIIESYLSWGQLSHNDACWPFELFLSTGHTTIWETRM